MDGNTGLLVCDAYADLKFIRNSQATSRAAFQSLATTNDTVRSSLILLIQQNMGFSLSSNDEKIDSILEQLIETAEKSVIDDFQILRRQSLIILCASFEHLTKCLIAEWLQYHVDQVLNLDELIKDNTSDYLIKKHLKERSPEGLYYVADKLQKHYVSKHNKKGSLFTVTEMISKHIPHQLSKFKNEIKHVVDKDFDEVFQVRNCIVHNGVKPNYHLSKTNNVFKADEKIVLTQQMMVRYFYAVENVAKGIFESSCIGYGL